MFERLHDFATSMNVSQAAEYLGLKDSDIQRLVALGQLTPMRGMRFPKRELVRFREANARQHHLMVEFYRLGEESGLQN